MFKREMFEIGGLVVIPDGFISKTEPGEIVGITPIGLNVTYYKDTEKSQTAFYSYAYLNHLYPELNDAVPW